MTRKSIVARILLLVAASVGIAYGGDSGWIMFILIVFALILMGFPQNND